MQMLIPITPIQTSASAQHQRKQQQESGLSPYFSSVKRDTVKQRRVTVRNA